ncbi:MAG: response regulator transcription factor [Prevotella sp.]|nr:response regulator transcription factor [Prevotella sp.]
MKILLADNQDISRAGLMFLLGNIEGVDYKYVEDKTELIQELQASPNGVVVLDYTLFDMNDVEELLILGQRFHQSSWLLFSEDLSVDFARKVMASSSQFGILMKDSPLSEINEALSYAIHHRRFICQHMTELLLAQEPVHEERVKLTKTETEILRDIALGMTTREIADQRFSSFHTVNTHRKNIFRKLGVNNAREATKYALRAGLVDSAEYYI